MIGTSKQVCGCANRKTAYPWNQGLTDAQTAVLDMATRSPRQRAATEGALTVNDLQSTVCAVVLLLAVSAPAFAQRPDLAGNYMRNGGTTDFGQWKLTDEGARRFKAYDFKTDDPALGCIAASWTRVWLNPNVVVQLTQGDDHVRLRYEWMDLDRTIPLVDPTMPNPPRGSIERHPALGRYAAWYDGDALVIDTVDVGPGYVSTMEKWAGLPQSRRMRTIERITRVGDMLRIAITHVDPAMYREPLVVTITYPRTPFELMDYGCNPEDAAVVEPRR
jgi:hypothetical protein